MCCCRSRPASENILVRSAASGTTRRKPLQRPSIFPTSSLTFPTPPTRRQSWQTGARASGSAIGVEKIMEARVARRWCSPTPSDLARPGLRPFQVLHPMSPRTGPQRRRVSAFDTFPTEFSSAVCFYMTGCAPPTIPDRKPAKSKFDPDRPYSPSCSILRFTRLCALLECAGLLRSGVGAWPTRRRASTSRVSGRGVARESACGARDVAFVRLRHMTRLAHSRGVPRLWERLRAMFA